MKLVLDLHTHSGYAGGAGEKNLVRATRAARLKGIDILGTGDCLYPKWISELKEQLVEAEPGLYKLNPTVIPDLIGDPQDTAMDSRLSGNDTNLRFLLQTELIFTLPQIQNPKRKQTWHAVFFFPNFEVIEKVLQLFDKWQVKNTIGRPFITCNNRQELQERITTILNTHPDTEIALAHIVTNNGFFGFNSQNNRFEDTFGKELNERIKLVETGLSADIEMLNYLPELYSKVLVSFSDSHSDALYRIGRELTVVETSELSYRAIINSLRNNKVIETVEFNPKEGRYYLTGHRDTKQHHHKGEDVMFIPGETPINRRCPVCQKPLTIGVFERVQELSKIQGFCEKTKPPTRNFKHLVPLIDLIPDKNPNVYKKLINEFGSEYGFWSSSVTEIESMLGHRSGEEAIVSSQTLEKIIKVRKGDFTFDPAGFDGVYGKLKFL